ncbi:MAG: SpoIIE family protein phosphatase, partial [Brevinematia bacterium]
IITDYSKIISSYKEISKVVSRLDSYRYGLTGDICISIVLHGGEQCIDVEVPVVIGDTPASYIRFGTTLRYLNEELVRNIIISVLIVLLLIGLGIVFSWFFAKSFSTPILKLKDAAVEFGRKNFDYNVEVLTNDELGLLAMTFNEMRKNIKEYSEHLEELVARRTEELQKAYEKLKEKDRLIQMELDFASRIQKGIMPNGGYRWNDFTIFGYSQPMEKIGGDFFDVFPVPGGRLLFYVADVSGHGIPAALITTMLKIFLLNISFEKQDPGEIIEELNQRIRIINTGTKEQIMANYLTIFAGVVDKEGNMSFSSGGHHKPVLYNQFSREFKEFPDTDGAIVGILEPGLYVCSSASLKLEDGDKIFLYTDGIIERRNLANEEIGMERFKKIIVDAVDKGLFGKRLLSHILNKIEEFSEGVPPKDDYTLLVVEKVKFSGVENKVKERRNI